MNKVLQKEVINDFEKGPITRSLFSNGTVCLHHYFAGMAGAVVSITFVVGSQNESENEHGIAHVIEHMLFKDGKGNTLTKAIEDGGGQINAYTSKENTSYELNCLSSKLSMLLPMYLQLILNPVFDKDDLEKEKKIILQELREDRDDHESSAYEFLFEKLYTDGLSHPIGGKLQDVKKVTVKDCKRFHKKFFTPNRMIITVSSGEKNLDLSDLLCSYLPSSIGNPIRLSPKDKIGNVIKGQYRQKKPISNSIVIWGINGLSIESKYYFDLVILDTLLCDGMSSILYKKFREEQSLIYALESSLFSYENNGHYCIGLQTHKKNEKYILSELRSIFESLETYSFNERDLEYCKERILDSYAYSFDSMEERVEYINNKELFAIKDFSTKRTIDEVQQVTAQSLRVLVKKLRQGGDFSLILSSKS